MDTNIYFILIILSLGIIIALTITVVRMWHWGKKAHQNSKIQSLHNDRLATIGLMWAEIAHEVYDPLSVLRGSLLALERTITDNNLKVIKQLINNSQDATYKIETILSTIKNAAKRDNIKQLNTYGFDLYQSTILESLQKQYEEQAVTLLIENNSCQKIKANSLDLEQVLINLVKNAYDAVYKLDDATQKWIKITCADNEKGWQINIQNGGVPIKKNLQDKIFTPFYTTKITSNGTGLGLSISKKIIDQNNGKLYLKNNDKNTNFVIEFPCQK